MRLSARSDYAIRALAELSARGSASPVKAEQLATAQGLPLRFLLVILAELRHAGLVTSQRGSDGGYLLARDASGITLADVIRAVEGPLAQVGDRRPETLSYEGAAAPLATVWIAVRANLRAILEEVTIADLVAGNLPLAVEALGNDPEAWLPH
ncbi:MAG: RrF2 family transcriptional regulator [Acidimicrobiales bacterium]